MMRMALRRTLSFGPLLIGISVVVFVMINLMPGDPARYLAGAEASDEQVAAVRLELGLDKPLWEQYGSWAVDAVRGDFGSSLIYGNAVTDLIVPRISVTASLALFALVFAVGAALVLAVAAAARPNSWVDRLVSGVSAIALSIPPFWAGMMLVLWFSVQRPLLPSIGYDGLGDGLWPWASHLLLPGVALGLTPAAELTLQLRASLKSVLSSDYVLAARAKGVRGPVVLFKHALKNASVPVVTVLGTRVGQLVAGAVTVETVFSLPGLGRLLVESTQGRDIPVLLGMVMVTTLAVGVFNLLADISQSYLDPRAASR